MKYHVTYFPMEAKCSVWSGNVLIKEWFDTREQANQWIDENTKKSKDV